MSINRFLSNKSVLLIPLLLLISCSSSKKAVEQETFYVLGHEHWNYSMAGHIDDDAVVASIIEPYRSKLEDQLNKVLTVSKGIIERDKPEGALGNLTADILRNRATREMGETVHVAILNNGGLRVPLPVGPVNVGHVFEMMPFENIITVLKFSGDQVIRIANEIAAFGGEPVSGIRFRIIDGRAEDILIGNRSVSSDSTYWIATNNWLADGGGDMPTLWEPIERIDKNVLLRDAFIEYLRHVQAIEPVTDSRIR